MTGFVAAAEPSGDRFAAAIVSELDLPFRGLAGPALRAAGVRSVADTDGAGVVGLVEAVRVLPRALRLRRRAREALDAGAAVSLTVDAPSLLLPVAAAARARGIPAVHVVAPQVWAWRPGRVRRVADSVDLLLCLFPFEPAWFAGHVRAELVGHPAGDLVGTPVPRVGEPTIALCPGSRAQELDALWPVFRRVAELVRRARPGAGFVVAAAPGTDRRRFGELRVVDGIAGVAGADAALVASGTATLELAALRVPMVVAYRVHPLTAAVARRWLRVPWVSLPNLLADAAVVPEHLQDLDPERIARDLLAVIGHRDQVPVAALAEVLRPGAARRAAACVAAYTGTGLSASGPGS